MSWITRFSLRNAVAVFIFAFLLILLGLFSFSRLKIDLLPNIEFPQLSAQIVYPGASPDDVNEQVITPLEQAFEGLEGVQEIQSASYDTIGVINLVFPFDTDLDRLEQQADTAIAEAGLPEEATVEISRLSFGAFPIFNISLFAEEGVDLDELLDTDVIPELSKIPGVNSVSVGGLTDTELQITVDQAAAEQAGLTLGQIKDQIDQKFFSFPAGQVQQNDITIPVKVEQVLESIDDLESLSLQNSFNPSAPPVTLGDIATIEEVETQDEITRYNDEEAYSMAVTKKQDANTVEVADEVLEVLEKYDGELSYSIGFNSAEGIEKSVETLVKEGLLGALFASIAVLIFLRNWRATIIAIISIPLSLLIAAIFLNQLGITLNIMTLGGMAVAVGRVVDDSIVVIENIFRRLRKPGVEMTNEMVETSTKEILKAITSSTITTVVVFLPLGFVSGITGEFFLPFALTVVFSLLASLLVAITIVPILAKFSFKKIKQEEKEDVLQRQYGRAIAWSLRRKWLVLLISLVLLGASFAIVPRLGFTFIPDEESRLVQASIELPSSTTLDRTNEVSLEVEQLLLGYDEVDSVTTSVGARDFATGIKLVNRAGYFISLNDDADLDAFLDKAATDMDELVTSINDQTTVSVSEVSTGGPPTNNNVVVDLFSTNLDDLEQAAAEVEALLSERDDLKYVSNNFSEKQEQLVVTVNTEAADARGISGFQILGAISDQTRPVELGELQIGEDRPSVQLSYDEGVTSPEEIEELTLFTTQGPVTLSEVADVEQIESFTSIQKLDGRVFARVEAQVNAENIRAVSTDVLAAVESDIDLPESVSLEGGGGSDETVEVFQQLGIAILSAIGLVYLTLLITFGKARIPFVILSSLLFVPIGALFGLLIAQEPLSVSVMIGFLMLIGIVTTNAIVMVDRINQNRYDKGMPIREALVEAGKTRLRPILMTAFATIAALIPLALTTSSGTLISKGLAITVIGGLTSSTLLTLIIVPVIYEFFFFRDVRRETKKA
ncbi:multidrug transporter AcrB [Chryseomicrobium excrementi]|uniref:Multidrug transporter AcrB n=1 Tax=Chryseomicrobium excrementi TaxID=2041346 RepID=A0A2M9EZ24_9BACL|nr:efflux RND transporter permease subunit [Chryseomicrobium excrementi]PJK16462.1 multidrug transporter AcrB [Chryseomicrobium excrementi]